MKYGLLEVLLYVIRQSIIEVTPKYDLTVVEMTMPIHGVSSL